MITQTLSLRSEKQSLFPTSKEKQIYEWRKLGAYTCGNETNKNIHCSDEIKYRVSLYHIQQGTSFSDLVYGSEIQRLRQQIESM